MIHVVVEGETLMRIAARYYGRWTLYPLIARANRLNFRDLPEAGRTITIPPVHTFARTHKVQPNDGYEKLANIYYGAEDFSELIRTANNRRNIYNSIGMSFVIPALVDAESIDSMRAF